MKPTKPPRKGHPSATLQKAQVTALDQLYESCDRVETLAALLQAVDERELLPPTPVKNAGIQILHEIQQIKTLLAELTRLQKTSN
jgi:hypothetical protein